MTTITIGHDSEFGLKHNGVLVSALDHIKEYEGGAGRYFPDNLNCEIAINPVDNLKDFHTYTDDLLDRIRLQGFDLVLEPTIKYPDEAMTHPLAYISGCNPDFSGYTEQKNKSPDFETMDGTRSAGGHIHVGDDSLDVMNWIRWMDVFVGMPLLIKEPPNERRKLYGGAGAMRPKPYGGEYRTLSNIWISSPKMRDFVWEGTHKAVEMSKKMDTKDIEEWTDVPKSIDTHDVGLAQKTIDRLYLLGVTNVS